MSHSRLVLHLLPNWLSVISIDGFILVDQMSKRKTVIFDVKKHQNWTAQRQYHLYWIWKRQRNKMFLVPCYCLFVPWQGPQRNKLSLKATKAASNPDFRFFNNIFRAVAPFKPVSPGLTNFSQYFYFLLEYFFYYFIALVFWVTFLRKRRRKETI